MGEPDTEMRFLEDGESDGLVGLLLTLGCSDPRSKKVQNYISFLEAELRKRDNPKREFFESAYAMLKPYKSPKPDFT